MITVEEETFWLVKALDSRVSKGTRNFTLKQSPTTSDILHTGSEVMDTDTNLV